MPRDDATSAHNSRVLIVCLTVSAPLLLSGFAALIWTLVQALIGTSYKPRPEEPTFCCPEVIETIILLSNVTVDPCSNIMSYACYKKGRAGPPGHRTACTRFGRISPDPPGQAAHTCRRHPEDALRELPRLCRVFRTETVELVERNEAAYVIVAIPAPDILATGGSDSTKYANAMLEAANAYTGLHVTIAAMTALIIRLQEALYVSAKALYVGRLSALDYVFPFADMSSWKVILREVPLIGMEDPINLVHIVNALRDRRPSVQAAALIYFSVHTTKSVFYEEIRHAEQATSLVAQASFCSEQIVKLFSLWDVLSTQQITSPDRDAVVMQLFDSVAEAVVADAEVAFSEHLNSSRSPQCAERRSHRARPRHDSTVRRINAARGLSQVHMHRKTLFEAFVSRAGNHIVISAGVYPLLNFNDTRARGNRTRLNGAAVNNAAVLGVLLADALWDALINSDRWDPQIRQRLIDHTVCMNELTGFILTANLKYPLLSLRSAARTIATPGWHQRVLAFGPYSFSASQIFFMLFVLHHPCQTLNVNDADVEHEVSVFTRYVEEFRHAFGCPVPSVDWADVCST
ncbi:hypothetical protein MTO96_019953 [Rhipicephalus appendiculatus]